MSSESETGAALIAAGKVFAEVVNRTRTDKPIGRLSQREREKMVDAILGPMTAEFGKQLGTLPSSEHVQMIEHLVQMWSLDRASLIYAISIASSGAAAKSRSAHAKRIAHIRHAENRSMKADVFTWLDDNMHRFPSMDSAAEAIAGRIAPVKFRAARDWVGAWKKLRSARKA